MIFQCHVSRNGRVLGSMLFYFHPSIGQIGMENQQKQLAKNGISSGFWGIQRNGPDGIRTCGCFQGLEGPSFCLGRGRLTVHKDSVVLNMAIFRRKSDLSEAATFTNLRGTWVRIPISKWLNSDINAAYPICCRAVTSAVELSSLTAMAY